MKLRSTRVLLLSRLLAAGILAAVGHADSLEPDAAVARSAKTAELSAALGSLQTMPTAARIVRHHDSVRERSARMSLVRSTTSWDRR